MYRWMQQGVAALSGYTGPGCNKLGLRDSEDERVVLPQTTPGRHNRPRQCLSPEELGRVARRKQKGSAR